MEENKTTITFNVVVKDGETVKIPFNFSDHEIKDNKMRTVAHQMMVSGAYYQTEVGSHVVVAPHNITRIVWFDSPEAEQQAVDIIKHSLDEIVEH